MKQIAIDDGGCKVPYGIIRKGQTRMPGWMVLCRKVEGYLLRESFYGILNVKVGFKKMKLVQ